MRPRHHIALLPLLLCCVGLASAGEPLVFTGSSAVKPVVDAAAAAYAAEHPGFAMRATASTTDASLRAVLAGEAQLGALLADPGPEARQLHPELRVIPIAIDGLVLVVHAANPVSGLSRTQVTAVFVGTTSSWHDLGGAAVPVRPLVRPASFASSGFFATCFGLECEEDGQGAGLRMRHRLRGASSWGRARAAILEDHQAGLQAVAADARSLTYAPFGLAAAAIAAGAPLKMLAIDGVAPTPSTIVSSLYPFTRPCLLLVNGEMRGELGGFVAFLASDAGQRVVAACGFVPLAR